VTPPGSLASSRPEGELLESAMEERLARIRALIEAWNRESDSLFERAAESEARTLRRCAEEVGEAINDEGGFQR
jgi:hypothetical protein